MQVDLRALLPWVVAAVPVIGGGAVLQYQVGELRDDVARSEATVRAMTSKDTEILVAIEGVRAELRMLMRDWDRRDR